jgi:uncharacterized protein (TIGR02246 family)
MRVVLFLAGLAVVIAMLAVRASDSQAEPRKQGSQPAQGRAADAPQEVERTADEQAIIAGITAFVKAYNAGDAKAIAGLFAPDGQVITEEGETVEGREAIEEGFRELFASAPQAQMEVFVDSIRLIGSDLAVEIGSIVETAGPGETPEYGRYTVLHAKRDGKWLMMLARDTPGEPPTSHERLLPLAFLLGEWIDDGGSSVVRTSCRWSDDQNFMMQDMILQIAGQDAMHVTQRIGWDPLSKRIRSWVFDTEGGFGEGVWARNGDSWIVKSTGVRPDGLAASSTSEIVPTGKDGYIWRVGDRVIGDEVQPPLEVKVVRVPPMPGEATN